MYHIFLIDSFIGGHFSCFHISTIVNNDELNMGMHISLQESDFIFFLGLSLRLGLCTGPFHGLWGTDRNLSCFVPVPAGLLDTEAQHRLRQGANELKSHFRLESII